MLRLMAADTRYDLRNNVCHEDHETPDCVDPVLISIKESATKKGRQEYDTRRHSLEMW